MIDLTERYELIKAIGERLKEQPNKPKRIKSSTSKKNNRIRRIAKWCLDKLPSDYQIVGEDGNYYLIK
ncbi:TPA: hypothetical protein JLU55_004810 [Escherichia coli]|uniref:hypothetical protein n=1 Tax=Escherichia coli TaxID=562 RepID=UPI0012EC312C|nr:hypothetical protein [Escherichia coli]MCK2309161.1 hypothetical protein [Escherichia coli]MCV8053983.1 hypothetical protein [Escherichia coli]MDF9105078.1 hypothetical protein [Escherichia coli]HAN6311040.1 hypothetical protein [Escherichia coli]HAN6349778.1 hypothetical protein [Escherichia coli]